MALRLALGARRGRVLRQLLTESVLLSLLGAVAGVLVGYLGLQALLASLPANTPRAEEVRIDLTVLGLTAALGVVTRLPPAELQIVAGTLALPSDVQATLRAILS